MQESSNFEFKVKISGISWDLLNNTYKENGYVKTFYAEDYDGIVEVLKEFINGDNRFVKVSFDPVSKQFKFEKSYCDLKKVRDELDIGLDGYLKDVAIKVHFGLYNDGDMCCLEEKLNCSDAETVLELINSEHINTAVDYVNLEYIVTIRVVVKKDSKNDLL